MSTRPHFAPLAACLLGFGLAPAPALALGGFASSGNAALAPHLVMVLSKSSNRHGACTGSVIAPHVVLTAAHCVAGKQQIAIAYPEDGSHVLQRVTAIAVHPNFSPRARVSIDLALVRLEGALPDRFVPLALDQGAEVHAVGARQEVAGFGLKADQDEASAGILRSAQVEVLPRLYPRFLRLGRSGLGGLDGFAICTGDSGGPVLTDAGEGRRIVGVIYGREKYGASQSCGTTAQAVRVAPQRAWLSGIMARWSRQALGPASREGGAKAE